MDEPIDRLDVEDDRPAKRLKIPHVSSKPRHYSADAKVLLHHQTPCQLLQAQLHTQSVPSQPGRQQAQPLSSQTLSEGSSMSMTAADPASNPTNNFFWPSCAPVFDPSWTWPTSAQETHLSTIQFITPQESVEADTPSTTVLPPPLPPPPHALPASVDEIGITSSSVHSAIMILLIDEVVGMADLANSLDKTGPSVYDLWHWNLTVMIVKLQDLPETVYLDYFNPVNGPAPTKNLPGGEPASAKPTFGHRQQLYVRTPFPNNQFIESPFRDCLGTFGLTRSQSFHRPVDGQVNGYIKFSWPKDYNKKRKPPARTSSILQISRITELDDVSESQDTTTSPKSVVVHSSRSTPIAVRDAMPDFSIDFSTYVSQTADMNYDAFTTAVSPSSSVLHNNVGEVVSLGAPQLIPSQYGYEAKMDSTDRRFWMFYIRNWCPGRSVLEDTNLWLKDFAQMHKSIGVRSAIQSLAGIYIYDYQPLESIRNRVNRRFEDAEKRFTQLLNDPATYRDESQANELITIGVILSMQDIVLTERRLKKPFTPRWLQGFRCAEDILQATDHGFRFWKTSNVQTSSLRISQSVIVGRAVILAQPMSSLPSPDVFDAAKDASRFGWLLYGNEKDMYQVHGGCGFSKKLLHIFSQVTYCAARLHQDAESPVVPVTAEYIHQELLRMRQWSPESQDWEVAKNSAAVIEWVRRQPPGYKIDENPTMTDVTAEAWRITAMLYLLCRVCRLPRNHPDVVSYLNDLAECIVIMPTSGMQFTAQAPLFPVFLLGILATVPKHRAVSQKWFDEVLQTPVRSSVPPLYAALKNIWGWIDIEFPPLMRPIVEAAQPIHLRHAWWEKLVEKVQDREKELLCLT
ncbi:hypothetical protein E4U55_001058 [Claviceps digitariae]|nr:hypothetical protein E4U55_001058 [Claviceps digitariae]